MQFQWGGIKVSMVPRGFWQKDTMRGFQHFENNKILKNEIHLLDANYQRANLNEVAENQTQLTEVQRGMLFELLTKHENLFQGKLGAWKGPLINIEVKAGTKPYHAKPFRIPQSIYPALKREVNRLVKIGVLSENPSSMWAAPSFAIPKKDGTIRFISDFRQLNKSAKRKPFPLPHIRDMLHLVRNMRWATAVDLSMG